MSNLISRPGARDAARNFGWLAAEKAVRLVLGTAVALWMARYLGPQQLGMWSYCLALVTLLGFLPALGLDAVVKREVLEFPQSAAAVLTSAVALRLVAGIITYAAILVVAWHGIGLSPEESRLVCVVGLLLFQPAGLVADLWLQSQLRSKLSVIAQLIGLSVGSILRVVLIVNQRSLIEFAWVAVIEAGVAILGLAWCARRSGMRVAFGAVTRSRAVELVAESWPLAFTGLAVVVYMKVDEVMLRQMAGVTAVGIYSAATRLSELWYFLPMGLASSVLPALLRARAQGAAPYHERLQHYYDLSAAAAYALSVPIALASPWIVRLLYGPAFAAAGPILAVHIWSSVFVFLGVARGQWLVNEHLQQFYLASTAAGAVANVLLNLVLIPRSGAMGAAIATVISYGLAAWLCSYCHPAVRDTARMQTRALLIPFRIAGLRSR